MKKYLLKALFTVVFCFSTLSGWAQFEGVEISPDAKISLITCSPGSELYSIFGHSAVRVNDPATGMDVIFNYGTFDFDEPGFYMKFIRGKLNYKLSAAHFRDFVYSYTRDNRSVYEQELNLTYEQRQTYWHFLANNYLPENRFYLYDFFFDNCATRIRDGVEAAFPQQVTFNIAHLDQDMSFRNLIDLYLPPHPWGDFGIDLGLGAPIDVKATPYEYMFLPDYLSKGFANASIGQGGQAVPLVGEVKVIFERDMAAVEPTGFFTPVVFGWLLFAVALALTVFNVLKHRRFRLFDVILFFAVGFLGIVLFLLWFATDHQAAANNFNLLWAIPTHLLIAFFLARKVLPKWTIPYMLFTLVLCIAFLLMWPMWPQQFHTAFFPIILTLALRAAYIIWFDKKYPHMQEQIVE